MPDKETIPQFAKRIKSKYPEYNDMNDTDLVTSIINKYPEYKDMVDFEVKKKEPYVFGSKLSPDISEIVPTQYEAPSTEYIAPRYEKPVTIFKEEDFDKLTTDEKVDMYNNAFNKILNRYGDPGYVNEVNRANKIAEEEARKGQQAKGEFLKSVETKFGDSEKFKEEKREDVVTRRLNEEGIFPEKMVMVEDKRDKTNSLEYVAVKGLTNSILGNTLLFVRQLDNTRNSSKNIPNFIEAYKRFQTESRNTNDWLSEYHPNTLEELAGTLFSLALDAPVFKTGGLMGEGLYNLGKYTVKSLIKTGVKEEVAQQVTRSAMQKILPRYLQGMASGAGAFGLYDASLNLVNQVKEGKDLKDISTKEILKAGVKGAVVGGIIGIMGTSGELAKYAVQKGLKDANGILQFGAVKGVGVLNLGAEAGALTIGSALLDGRSPTVKEYTDNLLLLGVLKVQGKLLGQSDTKTFQEYKRLFSDDQMFNNLEQVMLFKENETEASFIQDVVKNKDRYDEIVRDDKIPLATKSKIGMLLDSNADMPDVLAMTYDIKNGERDTLEFYDNEGRLIYVSELEEGKMANEQIQDLLQTANARREILKFNALPAINKVNINEKLVLAGYERGIENELINSALETNPSKRNPDQIKIVNDLYKFIEEEKVEKPVVEEPKKEIVEEKGKILEIAQNEDGTFTAKDPDNVFFKDRNRDRIISYAERMGYVVKEVDKIEIPKRDDVIADVEQKPIKTLKDVIDEYDTNVNFGEFYDNIKSVNDELENPIIEKAIKEYEDEAYYDRTKLGLRGDGDAYEGKLIETVRNELKKEPIKTQDNAITGRKVELQEERVRDDAQLEDNREVWKQPSQKQEKGTGADIGDSVLGEKKFGKEVVPNEDVKTDLDTVLKEYPLQGLTESEAKYLYELKDNPIEEYDDTGYTIDHISEKITELTTDKYKAKTAKQQNIINSELRMWENYRNQQEMYDMNGALVYHGFIDWNFDKNEYEITTEGKEFVESLDARIETRKNVKEGTDMFPEMANIPELKKEEKKVSENIVKPPKKESHETEKKEGRKEVLREEVKKKPPEVKTDDYKKQFEKKHEVSYDKFNKKLQEYLTKLSGDFEKSFEQAMEYVGIESDWESRDDMIRDFAKIFLEGDLPSKLPPKKGVIYVELNGDINVKPIKTKPLKVKTKQESLKEIIDTNPLKPQLNGVFHDSKNKNLVATDGNCLVVIHDERIKTTELIDPKTGKVIDQKFPDYMSVIPNNPIVSNKANINILIDELSGLERASRFISDHISAKIVIGDNQVFFTASVLNRALKSLQANGITSIVFEINGRKTGGVTVRDASGKNKSFGIVMPLMYDTMRGKEINPLTKEIFKSDVSPQSADRIRDLIKQKETNNSWAENWHEEGLKKGIEKKDEFKISYHEEKLKEAKETKTQEIELLKEALNDIENGRPPERPKTDEDIPDNIEQEPKVEDIEIKSEVAENLGDKEIEETITKADELLAETPIKEKAELKKESKELPDKKAEAINKISEGIDGLIAKLGGRKEFSQEQKTTIIQDLQKIVEGITILTIEELRAVITEKIKPLIEKFNISDKDAKDIIEQSIGVSLKNSEIELKREEFGLEPLTKKDVKHDADLIAEADQQIKDGFDTKGLVDDFLKNPRPHTDLEYVLLSKRGAELEAKLRSLDPRSPEFDKTLKEIDDTQRASSVSGSDSGSGLGVRGRIKVIQDDTLSNYLLREQETNLNAPLTEGQKNKSKKELDEITDATRNFEERLREKQEEINKLRAEKQYEEVKREVRKAGRKTKKENLDAEFTDLAKQFRMVTRGQLPSGFDPQIPVIIAKMMRNRAEKGVVTLAEVIDAIHEQLSDILDKKQIHDIIAGEYNEKRAARNEVARNIYEMKQEAKLLNELERANKGEPKTEKEQISRNQKSAALRRQINEIRQRNDRGGLTKEELAYQKKIEALKQRVFDLDSGISPVPKTKNTPTEEVKDLQRQIREHELTILAKDKQNLKRRIAKLEEELKKPVIVKSKPKLPDLRNDKELRQLKDKEISLRLAREVRLLKQEYANRDVTKRIFDNIVSYTNVPRAIMSSGDLSSAILRQAIVASIAHPVLAAHNIHKMFRMSVSQSEFDRMFYNMKQSDRWDLSQASGLFIADPHDPRLVAKEEMYQTNQAEKIPVLKYLISMSNRGYTGYLNGMRWDMFNQLAERFEASGRTFQNSPELFKSAANLINNETGRGNMGILETMTPVLNFGFFSPRLYASRINLMTWWMTPKFYRKVPREIRVEYAKDMAKMLGAGLTVLVLAKLAGAEVEYDPRSSDFGKIKIGNTRYDIWGGFQQYIRVVAQVICGMKKSTYSGELMDINGDDIFGESRGDVMGRFVRGKLSPALGSAWDLAKGRDLSGQKVTVQNMLRNKMMPLIIPDILDAYQDGGVQRALVVAATANWGIGTQTYGMNVEEKINKLNEKKVEKPLKERKAEAMKDLKSLERLLEEGEKTNKMIRERNKWYIYEVMGKTEKELDLSKLRRKIQAKKQAIREME
jgi:hypothetical protein